MTLNPDNDVYQGDLSTLNIRKQSWSREDDRARRWNIITWVVLAAGLAGMVYVSTRTYGGTTMVSQLPLFVMIWVVLLLAYLSARQGKKISQEPFYGFHSARFEVDDDTVYYVYQKGMTLKTYYIRDDAITRIWRDNKAGVLLIEGDAVINTQSRRSEKEEAVSSFYALVPFDKYDLDDLLAPYKGKVRNADGKLRDKYIAEQTR